MAARITRTLSCLSMGIPITSRIRSSQLFEQAARTSISAQDLSVWSDDLLSLGLVSDAIVKSACNPDYSVTKTHDLLCEICNDLEIDTAPGFEQLKEIAIIEEYRNGHFTPPHILFACNIFRRQTGFPEQLHAKFVYDDGIETVTYHGLHSGITGHALETACVDHLTKHKIIRNPAIAG